MAENQKDFIRHLEQALREGKTDYVRTQITKFNLSKLNRTFIYPVSNLARRVGLISISLRILYPYIYPQKPILKPATSEEIIEYAVCLARIGAQLEARNLLNKIDPNTEPRVLLYQAFSLFQEWNYEDAIPNIIQFLNHNYPDEYQNLVARVNLIASYISVGKLTEAKEQLQVLLPLVTERKYNLLRGNLLELSAQLWIMLKNSTEAEKALQEASKFLADQQLAESIYVEKWRLVLATQKNKDHQKNCTELHQLRAKALALNHWEIARGTDYFICKFSGDRRRFHFLYHGSPLPKFREMLIKDFPEMPSPKKDYVRLLGPIFGEPFVRKGPPIPIAIDTLAGTTWNKSYKLKPGQLLQRYLLAISSDFYLPSRVGTLFQQLFPEEYFNPETSPDKVKKTAKRFEKWVEQAVPDIRIIEQDGFYKLIATKPTSILVPVTSLLDLERSHSNSENSLSNDSLIEFHSLYKWAGNRNFRSTEVAKEFGISVSTATRLIRKGIVAGKIEQLKKGPQTTFCFKAQTKFK